MSILSEDQTVGNTYVVERFLGEGAFAEVYRVKHRFLGRQAMKVFKTPGMTPGDVEHQLEEAVLLSQIGHLNIIRVFDANVFESAKGLLGYFTMEYIAGGNLEHFWKSFGNSFIPVENVVEIIKQTCRGVAVGHSKNPPIIHRDIKPQNILIGYDGNGLRARVSDFGLAKRANPLTLMVSARGTLCFKAPETFKKANADSCSGDVWALGCTLYLLLTDKLPFAEIDETGIVSYANFNIPLLPAHKVNNQVDAGLQEIIDRALAIEPASRYSDACEMLEDLESWKPHKKGAPRKSIPGEYSKTVLGPISSLDQQKAKELVEQAIGIATSANRLSEAADLMEQAFNKWPALRQEYEYRVTLWRRGIMS